MWLLWKKAGDLWKAKHTTKEGIHEKQNAAIQSLWESTWCSSSVVLTRKQDLSDGQHLETRSMIDHSGATLIHTLVTNAPDFCCVTWWLDTSINNTTPTSERIHLPATFKVYKNVVLGVRMWPQQTLLVCTSCLPWWNGKATLACHSVYSKGPTVYIHTNSPYSHHHVLYTALVLSLFDTFKYIIGAV